MPRLLACVLAIAAGGKKMEHPGKIMQPHRRFTSSYSAVGPLQERLAPRSGAPPATKPQGFGRSAHGFGRSQKMGQLDRSATLRKLEALRAVATHAQEAELSYALRAWVEGAALVKPPAPPAAAGPRYAGSALTKLSERPPAILAMWPRTALPCRGCTRVGCECRMRAARAGIGPTGAHVYIYHSQLLSNHSLNNVSFIAASLRWQKKGTVLILLNS